MKLPYLMEKGVWLVWLIWLYGPKVIKISENFEHTETKFNLKIFSSIKLKSLDVNPLTNIIQYMYTYK